MSTYARYLIAGPVADGDRARAAAAAWEGPTAATMYRQASLYVLAGGDPAVGTHTCSYGLINTDYAPAIEAAIAAEFPGWVIIAGDDAQAALAQAGFGRVAVTMP